MEGERSMSKRLTASRLSTSGKPQCCTATAEQARGSSRGACSIRHGAFRDHSWPAAGSDAIALRQANFLILIKRVNASVAAFH
jgi:hypothetical protein